jgi:tetratricopeptide (TPR) repeat protein
MSNKFQKKNFAQLKKEEEAILDRDLDNFQGSKTELFFIKLGRKIQRKRLQVFGSIFGLFFIIASLLGYFEYSDYREVKATERLELILEQWQRGEQPANEDRIKTLESFLADDSFGIVDTRVAKTLSDLYAEAGEYKKAANLLEIHGVKIPDIREAKAYYFFLAGNYRELADDKDIALKNYETASSLLENLRETPSFRAWSLYHTGRLKAEKGDITNASEVLRKVLLIEQSDAGTDLTEVKKLATFLLLKISKKG